MLRQFQLSKERWREGIAEAMWETLIALATVAAISISIVSLAAHLNQARVVVEAAQTPSGQHASNPDLASGLAGFGSPAPVDLN
ncbi:MAG TPA: hypothetical protein VKT99_18770 [Xanthobacteraceae bacterium]|jgi:hypothetical protein|nr:hypothetical protein [Xanthobacteraceae bacterium]